VIGQLDQTLHDGLTPVGGGVPAYATPGLGGDVSPILERVERARDFFVDQFGIEPRVAVLLLGPDDWAARSSHPLYGMPNFRAGNLVLAGEPNAFWAGLASLAEGEVADGRERLERAYPSGGDGIDLTPFFDLLAVHELAHIFIEADGRTPSKFWLLELACNLFLHAYVEVEEPEHLPTLAAFSSVFAEIDASRFTHRTLDDFERSYAYGMDGANYGWFQTRLHVGAKHLYDTGGLAAIHGMWRVLAEEPGGDLESLFGEHLGPAAVELLHELSAPSPSPGADNEATTA
jgi:hypothetical protein